MKRRKLYYWMQRIFSFQSLSNPNNKNQRLESNH